MNTRLRWFRLNGKDVQAINIVEANNIIYGGASMTLNKGIVARDPCEPMLAKRAPHRKPLSLRER